MSTLKTVTAPLWFPFWFLWRILASAGRALWFLFTLFLRATLLLLLIALLLAWFR